MPDMRVTHITFIVASPIPEASVRRMLEVLCWHCHKPIAWGIDEASGPLVVQCLRRDCKAFNMIGGASNVKEQAA